MVVTAIDNLTSLHNHEEGLRSRSLAVIEADAALSDHWHLVAEAMNAIWAFTHDHVHGSENELTLQYLGIRLFNAAGASIKLALSGYYQKAFDQVRDCLVYLRIRNEVVILDDEDQLTFDTNEVVQQQRQYDLDERCSRSPQCGERTFAELRLHASQRRGDVGEEARRIVVVFVE